MNWLGKWLRSLKQYFRDAWNELRRVTWPSKKELWNTTLTVLVVIALAGVFLGAIDLLLTFLVNLYIR
ncbi:MAG TPA: preprotein translocase subunit SecE [Candidatus Atribacteria bacterium]|nr:preprotein translocase subunit SecE [Candidatus Atribacteria bacterium]HQE25438.1 preprotein translocase subunit SecE [Candidatus Atribacteria bacterium]